MPTFGQSFGRFDVGMMVLFIMLTGHRRFNPPSPYIYHLHTATVPTSTFLPSATTISHTDKEIDSPSYVGILLRLGETGGSWVAGPITAASRKRRIRYNETTPLAFGKKRCTYGIHREGQSSWENMRSGLQPLHHKPYICHEQPSPLV